MAVLQAESGSAESTSDLVSYVAWPYKALSPHHPPLVSAKLKDWTLSYHVAKTEKPSKLPAVVLLADLGYERMFSGSAGCLFQWGQAGRTWQQG